MPALQNTLDKLQKGQKGFIQGFLNNPSLDTPLEQRFLEFGFIEGACCEVLHEGFPHRDPIAVKIGATITVALRRSEAAAILVKLLP
ncbi:MAG: ferrous iron transport protein A [Gammaproteobacteria bacterium]|nr:ferrous iron transport protein A [Gammaproteobacteria bacterium]